MPEVIRARRAELGLSQAQLAVAAKVDTRQIRRYEAGEQQPGLSVGELAGEPSHRVNLTGDWWAAWQTLKDGTEVINAHQVRCQQRGELITIDAITRGTVVTGGGYLWRGELRLWDNEILMGWYVATEGSVRSKGTMYFVVHPHGQTMSGRWVGLSHDGPVITGWGALAKTEEAVRKLMNTLKREQGVPA